jgi:protein-S-isoprenylcysteine O-methyltransferase Ste14
MRATALEFRLRMLILVAIAAIGVWAPWVGPWDLGRRISSIEWLALQISRTGWVSFSVATPIVIVFGALLAAVGMVLRVWGAAYLGYSTVHHADMQAGAVMAAGPYRYVRNPLYLGGWFMFAAISLLVTPSGALFIMVFAIFFQFRLILGEEAFLDGQLGEPYREYLRAVPRLIPRLHPSLSPAAAQPHWLTAVLTEIMPIGTFVTLAIVSWWYDNELMLKAILISLVVSLVVRGLMKALIPTCVFLAAAPAAWGLFHLSPIRSMLIGLGAALVARALMPRKQADQDAAPSRPPAA